MVPLNPKNLVKTSFGQLWESESPSICWDIFKLVIHFKMYLTIPCTEQEITWFPLSILRAGTHSVQNTQKTRASLMVSWESPGSFNKRQASWCRHGHSWKSFQQLLQNSVTQKVPGSTYRLLAFSKVCAVQILFWNVYKAKTFFFVGRVQCSRRGDLLALFLLVSTFTNWSEEKYKRFYLSLIFIWNICSSEVCQKRGLILTLEIYFLTSCCVYRTER